MLLLGFYPDCDGCVLFSHSSIFFHRKARMKESIFFTWHTFLQSMTVNTATAAQFTSSKFLMSTESKHFFPFDFEGAVYAQRLKSFVSQNRRPNTRDAGERKDHLRMGSVPHPTRLSGIPTRNSSEDQRRSAPLRATGPPLDG